MEWSYDTFVWILVMILIPVVAFLANIAIRYKKQMPMSSAADLILMLMIYSGSVLADPTVVQNLVSGESRPFVVPVHLTFLLILGLNWIMAALYVEERIDAYHYLTQSERGASTRFPWFSWLLPWVLSFAIALAYLFIISHQ